MLTKHAYINQAVHLAKVDKEVWIQPCHTKQSVLNEIISDDVC